MRILSLGMALVTILFITSCNSDDDTSTSDECQTCAGYQEDSGLSFPSAFVCKAANGNAEVSGVDTGFPFSVYITELEKKTTCE